MNEARDYRNPVMPGQRSSASIAPARKAISSKNLQAPSLEKAFQEKVIFAIDYAFFDPRSQTITYL